MDDQDNTHATQGWNTYWQGQSDTKINSPGGVSHPVFPKFWALALGEFLAIKPDGKILDIGTGNGALIEYLSQVPNINLKNASCVDVSRAAIDAVQQRFPDVTGIAADAADIPLDAGCFDLITSQFGIEYAGPAAIDEATRLLAPGGSLLFLMHMQSGALYQECSAAIDALDRVAASNFLALASDFFTQGFAAVRGGDRAPYEKAARELNPAIQELESILSEHGEHVAGDTIVYLHSTVQNMHSRIQYYDPDEVLGWLQTTAKELLKHAQRMESMRAAAMDEESFKKLTERLESQGLRLEKAVPLQVEGDALPVAWLLQASDTSSDPLDTKDETT